MSEAMCRQSVAGAFDHYMEADAITEPRASAVWDDESRSTIMDAMARQSVAGAFDLDMDIDATGEPSPRGSTASGYEARPTILEARGMAMGQQSIAGAFDIDDTSEDGAESPSNRSLPLVLEKASVEARPPAKLPPPDGGAPKYEA